MTISNIQPSQAGSYVMVASNAYGTATSSVSSVTVTPRSPEITRQPWSQSLLPSSNATFVVSAKGTEPFTYQWRLNGVDLAGGTNSSLTLTNVQWSDVGAYSVVVSNQIGMDTSLNAMLTILRFPSRFGVSGTNAGLSSNGFGMQLKGLSGHGAVVIYGSTNLSDWVPLLTNPPVSGTLPFVDSTATNLPSRFYKAVEQ